MNLDEKLRSAFIEAYAQEYEEVAEMKETSDTLTEDDIKYHQKKIRKKIEPTMQHPCRHINWIRTGFIAACLCILLCGFIGNPAIGGEIFNFILEKYDEYSTVLFVPNSSNAPNEKKEPQNLLIPEGYTIVEVSGDLPGYYEACILTPSNSYFLLIQVAAGGTGLSVDTEGGTAVELKIEEHECVGIEKDGESTLIFSDEEFGYLLSTQDGMEVLIEFVHQLFK